MISSESEFPPQVSLSAASPIMNKKGKPETNPELTLFKQKTMKQKLDSPFHISVLLVLDGHSHIRDEGVGGHLGLHT